MVYAFIAAGWLACSVFAVGALFARYQRKYDMLRRRDFASDRWFCLVMAATGPCALLAAVEASQDGYGWLWPWGAKAKREAGLA
jgi:hypothetical protein